MRWSQLLIPTQKSAPPEAQAVSHQLMVRAGLVRQVAAGVYEFLPLGLRSLRKACGIIRRELESIGASEVLLPAMQPADLWQKSGRGDDLAGELLRLKDHQGRWSVMADGYEEAACELVAACVNSHKQLPMALYQIAPRFRDEGRPRHGLLGLRESLAADAWSFHADGAGLDAGYDAMQGACERILSACGVPFRAAEAEGGNARAYLVPSAAGGETLVTATAGAYAATLDGASTGQRPWSFEGSAGQSVEKVHTPNLPSIDEVARFMNVKPAEMLKTMVFQAAGGSARWLVAVVRGDHDVNVRKLSRIARERFGIEEIRLVDSPEVRQSWAIGFVGPGAACRAAGAVMMVDPDAAQPRTWVVGANEVDYHLRGFTWPGECGTSLGDPAKVAVADIRNAVEGDPAPSGGGRLALSPAIEIGRVSRPGARYCSPLGAAVHDAAGRQQVVQMACCSLNVGRLLAAVVEASHDERGILWPTALAPFPVVITPIVYSDSNRAAADRLHAELTDRGVDVLLDDRDLRAGAKFADADLIGFPVRINVGERGLREGKVEVKLRGATAAEMVPLGEACGWVGNALA